MPRRPAPRPPATHHPVRDNERQATVMRTSRLDRRGRPSMRRFIVEVVVDAVLLADHHPAPRASSTVAQPFPFGPDSAPIVELRGAGVVGFLIVGGDPGAGQPLRPTGPRGADRPAAVLDDGPVRGVINAIALWLTSVIAPIKIGTTIWPSRSCCGSSSRPRCTRSCRPSSDAVLGLNGPDLEADRSRGDLGVPRVAARRRAGTRSSRTCASSRSTTRSTPRASTSPWRTRRSAASGAGSPAVVLGEKDEVIDDPTGPARIRLMLQQLGPTYVKIGQMMASRSDVLPPEWITELSKLQSEAAPFAYDDVVDDRHEGARRARPRSCSRRSTRCRSRPRRPRRSTGRRCTTGRSSRSRSSGRGSWPRRRPTSASSRSSRRSPSAGSRWPARSGSRASSTSSPQGVLKELDYRNEAYHARRLADGMTALPGGPRPDRLRRAVGPARPHDGVRQRDQDLEGGRAARGRLRHRRARDRLHPRDHQAGPRRRLLPRRPAPGQHPGRPDVQADHLPRPRPRRAAQRASSGSTCSA